MRTPTTQRLAGELRAIRRTGEHPDGRPLGHVLAPAIDRIIAFLEHEPDLERAAREFGAHRRRVSS